LLFAHDWWLTASGRDFKETLLRAVFGLPMGWKKLTSGFALAWIGYEIDLRSYTLGVSECRAVWLSE
jgi:hypothetical protein